MSETSEASGTGAPEAAGIPKAPEARNNREKVVEAFRASYGLLENTPDHELTPEERWTRDSIKAAKEKTLDQGKSTFTNTFEDLKTGETYTQEEGIPIENLLDFMRKRLSTLPVDSEEAKNIRNWGHILYRNSQPYARMHRMGAVFVARVEQEAHFVYKDSRATGDRVADYYKGLHAINRRFELVIPAEESTEPLTAAALSATSPTTPDATPVAAPIAASSESATPPPVPAPPSEAPPPAPAPTSPADSGDSAEPPTPPAAPVPAASPVPTTVEEIRREITFVNRTTDIRKKAAELAEEQLQNEMRRGSAWNPLNWPRKIALRLAEEHYRQRFIERAARTMIEHNNSYLTMDLVRNEAVNATHRKSEEQEAGKAKIEQIKTGEQLEGQEVREAQGALKEAILRDIIRPAVEGTQSTLIGGNISTEADIQRALRAFVEGHQDDPNVQSLFGRDATQYGRLAEYFASDILEVANTIKEDLATHRYTLNQLDTVVKVRLANVSWSAETQANFKMVDRAVAWAERNRLTGVLINPATIGAAFSLGTFAFMRATGASAQAMQYAVPGFGILPGALFAAARRSYDLKRDRAAHQVERAYNRQIPQNAPRREALEQFAYETASVQELLDGGRNRATVNNDSRGLNELLQQNLSDVNNRANVLRRIAEIKTRLDFSAREKVDLVTFEAQEHVEQGRLGLIKAICEARQKLRRAGMSNDDITQLETNLSQEWSGFLSDNVNQRNREFRNYRIRNAAGAAVFGGAAGLAAGLATQEGLALAGRAVPSLSETPVVGGLFGRGQTALERAVNTAAAAVGQPEVFSPPPSLGIDAFRDAYTQGGSVDVNKHLRAVIGQDHSVALVDTTGQPVPGVPKLTAQADGRLLADGALPAQLQSELKTAGFELAAGPTTTKDILLPSGTHIDTTTGHTTTIPDGSEWRPDPTDPSKWDLVVSSSPDRILINDAVFDKKGDLLSYDPTQSIIPVEDVERVESTTPGGSHTETRMEKRPLFGENGEWKNHATPITERHWHTIDQLKMYNWKVNGDGTVVIDTSHIKTLHGHVGGIYISLPDHAKEGIYIPGNEKGIIVLDPNSQEVIPNSNGLTMGKLSKMILNQEALKTFKQASEYTNRPDIFNLSINGKRGFIETAWLETTQDNRQILHVGATITGTSPAPTEIDVPVQVTVQNPPIKTFSWNVMLNRPIVDTFPSTILTPPDIDLNPPPIIPIPFAPRHPLEPLGMEIEMPTYYKGLFPKGARMRDMIKRGRSRATIDTLHKDTAEGAEALRQTTKAFRKSDRIYIILGGAIGDAVIGTAYVKAVQEGLRATGKNIPITVVVNKDHANLFNGLISTNTQIKTAPRGLGAQEVQTLLSTSSDQNPLVFDFEHFLNEGPTIEQTTIGSKTITTLNNLFPAAIEMYNNETDGERRYAAFMEELLRLPQNSINGNRAQPTIILPPKEGLIYDKIANKTGIDKANSNQIAIVVEASVPGKRYSMDKWAKLISQLKTEYSGYQFNIIYNSHASPSSGGYTQTAIENSLRTHGVLGDCNIIDGGNPTIISSLMDLAILTAHQKLVISNDTGLGHIAGALERGPSVVTLFMPERFPPSFWVSSKKQTAVEVTDPTANTSEHELDDTKKGINQIQIEDIMQRVRPLL